PPSALPLPGFIPDLATALSQRTALASYPQTRTCGARKGSSVAYVADIARNIRNRRTEKAREVGLTQEKTNNSYGA
ncbi:MAG TPA: hypothetical protein VN729_08930, partial [Ktedonobacteraceae bacterium]|nr:hypothetical protein [Ktedonobacteraceae bacterium]